MNESLIEKLARAMHAKHVGDNGPMWEDSWRKPYFMDMARVALDVLTAPPHYEIIDRLRDGLYCSCGDRLCNCDTPSLAAEEEFERHLLSTHGLVQT